MGPLREDIDEDELPEAQFEGMWYRWMCPSCDEMNETEEDIRKSTVECDLCHAKAVVIGD